MLLKYLARPLVAVAIGLLAWYTKESGHVGSIYITINTRTRTAYREVR